MVITKIIADVVCCAFIVWCVLEAVKGIRMLSSTSADEQLINALDGLQLSLQKMTSQMERMEAVAQANKN